MKIGREKKPLKRISGMTAFVLVGFGVIADFIQFIFVFLSIIILLAPILLAVSWFLSFVFTGLLVFILKTHGMSAFSARRITQFFATVVVETIPILGNVVPSLTILALLTIRSNRKMYRLTTERQKAKEEHDARIKMRRVRYMQYVRERREQLRLREELQEQQAEEPSMRPSYKNIPSVANDNTPLGSAQRFAA